jgi:hypothetical protein
MCFCLKFDFPCFSFILFSLQKILCQLFPLNLALQNFRFKVLSSLSICLSVCLSLSLLLSAFSSSPPSTTDMQCVGAFIITVRKKKRYDAMSHRISVFVPFLFRFPSFSLSVHLAPLCSDPLGLILDSIQDSALVLGIDHELVLIREPVSLPTYS